MLQGDEAVKVETVKYLRQLSRVWSTEEEECEERGVGRVEWTVMNDRRRTATLKENDLIVVCRCVRIKVSEHRTGYRGVLKNVFI